jgi:hypothetical protein
MALPVTYDILSILIEQIRGKNEFILPSYPLE